MKYFKLLIAFAYVFSVDSAIGQLSFDESVKLKFDSFSKTFSEKDRGRITSNLINDGTNLYSADGQGIGIVGNYKLKIIEFDTVKLLKQYERHNKTPKEIIELLKDEIQRNRDSIVLRRVYAFINKDTLSISFKPAFIQDKFQVLNKNVSEIKDENETNSPQITSAQPTKSQKCKFILNTSNYLAADNLYGYIEYKSNPKYIKGGLVKVKEEFTCYFRINLFGRNNRESKGKVVELKNPALLDHLIRYVAVDENNDGTIDSRLDRNKDGKLQESEVNPVTHLSINNQNSLEGLDKFVNLKKLSISKTNIDQLNLSGLPFLEDLKLYKINTNISLENYENLKSLVVSWSEMKELKIKNLTNLESLRIVNTKLEKLDLFDLSRLKSIDIYNDKLITELNLQSLPSLEKLELTENDSLRLVKIKNVPKLETLECINPSLERMNISQITSLKNVSLSGPLKSLDPSRLIKLEHLKVSRSKIENLVFENLPELVQIKLFRNENLMDLNINNLPQIESLVVAENKQLKKVNLYELPILKSLSFSDSSLKKFDISDFTKLKSCSIEIENLKEFTMSNPNLVHLSLSSMHLSILDMSETPNLETFRCYKSKFDTIYMASDSVKVDRIRGSKNILVKSTGEKWIKKVKIPKRFIQRVCLAVKELSNKNYPASLELFKAADQSGDLSESQLFKAARSASMNQDYITTNYFLLKAIEKGFDNINKIEYCPDFVEYLEHSLKNEVWEALGKN